MEVTVELYVDGSINCPSDGPGLDPSSLLGVGGYIYLTDRVVLWAAYNAGLTSESPDGVAKLGASFAF